MDALCYQNIRAYIKVTGGVHKCIYIYEPIVQTYIHIHTMSIYAHVQYTFVLLRLFSYELETVLRVCVLVGACVSTCIQIVGNKTGQDQERDRVQREKKEKGGGGGFGGGGDPLDNIRDEGESKWHNKIKRKGMERKRGRERDRERANAS